MDTSSDNAWILLAIDGTSALTSCRSQYHDKVFTYVFFQLDNHAISMCHNTSKTLYRSKTSVRLANVFCFFSAESFTHLDPTIASPTNTIEIDALGSLGVSPFWGSYLRHSSVYDLPLSLWHKRQQVFLHWGHFNRGISPSCGRL